MAGRREEEEPPLPAFLPPHAHAAMPPPVSHEQDEEARFWSAMHDGEDDEERQQQLVQQQHNHTPPSPVAPSRLSLPRFTAARGPANAAGGGEEEDGTAPLLTPVPPQPPPSSSSASSSSSSTGGGAGVKAGGGRKRPPRRGGGGANANGGGIGGGVGGAAGLRQGLEEMFRAITGAAGGIVCRGVQEGNGARRRPGGSSSILELNRPGAQHDGFQYRRMEEEEGGDGPGGGLEEGEEDEEDEEDGEADRGWAPVANLDVFFETMYRYYQQKGFNSILASTATNLLSMAFTVALSAWLLAFVDWGKLTTCHDEESCLPFGHYIHARAMSRYGLVWAYCLLFVLYWCASCYWALMTLRDAAEMRTVYNDRLGISEEELTTIEWHEVVERFLEKQRSGQYRVSISQEQELTAHDIASRIMRRENFLIALIDQEVLDLRPVVPVLGWKGQDPFLTRNLEWSLHVCLLHDMLDYRSFTLRRDVLNDAPGLQRRFVLAGLVQLALTPFLLVFMGMQFFLQNAQEWQQKKNYLGPRQWSPLAKWRFREYNEVPHLLDRRLHAAYPHAMAYTRQCPRPVIAVLARCAAYVSGALVAVLLLFTLLDESILLYVRLWDRNLLWYVGVFSAAFAMSRSLIPGPEEQQPGHQEATMQRVAAYTHHFPRRWRGRCTSPAVRAEFLGSLFQYKTALFQQEILSVLITPFILLYSLPECAPAILSFLRQHSATVDGLGSVCAFSLFDLDQYGSARYGGSNEKQGTKKREGGASESDGGKVEKSLLNFCVNYPEWARKATRQAALAAEAAARAAAVEGEGQPQQLQQQPSPSPLTPRPLPAPGAAVSALRLLRRLHAFQEAELTQARQAQERAWAASFMVAKEGEGEGLEKAPSSFGPPAVVPFPAAAMGLSYRGGTGPNPHATNNMDGSSSLMMQQSGYWGTGYPPAPAPGFPQQQPYPPLMGGMSSSLLFGRAVGTHAHPPPMMSGGGEMENSFYWLERYGDRFQERQRERGEERFGGVPGVGAAEEGDRKVGGVGGRRAKTAASPEFVPQGQGQGQGGYVPPFTGGGPSMTVL